VQVFHAEAMGAMIQQGKSGKGDWEGLFDWPAPFKNDPPELIKTTERTFITDNLMHRTLAKGGLGGRPALTFILYIYLL
jgi:hypothetical protein